MQFHFAGFVEPDGSYPIHMEPVDPDEVAAECKRIIAENLPYLPGPDSDFDDICDDFHHGEHCLKSIEFLSEPCRWEVVQEAERRLGNLRRLKSLTDCARDPTRANGLSTLQGMAPKSFIYDMK